MNALALLAPLAASTLLIACAEGGAPSAVAHGTASAATEGRSCFRPEEVTNFSAPNDRVVYVRAGARVFEMRLMGDCPDVDWSMRLGIQSTGSDWICSGIDATILAPSPTGPQRCPVSHIRPLSSAEVARLPPKFRP